VLPTPTDARKAEVEQIAQAILDARALYPDFCSLANLYDEITMPPELRKAHQANDKTVMQAYLLGQAQQRECLCSRTDEAVPRSFCKVKRR